MSEIVLVCFRNPGEVQRTETLLQRLSSEIIPDNIEPAPTESYRDENVRVAIVNPNGMYARQGSSILLGHLVGKPNDWWKPGAPQPDGAYGIFRVGKERIELVADRLASRTIWYVYTDDVFIASTSQRAAIMQLGSFEPDANAVSWMLSAGSLGPEKSWDIRLRRVEADSTVSFDRQSWSVKLQSKPVVFDEERLSHAEHRERLAAAIENVVTNMEIDYSTVALPLSGGFDSRSLLMMLRERGLKKCVTWGLESSLNDKRNDAYVAKMVAKHFGVEHQYLVTDPDRSAENVETIFDRILVAGEGRSARISGYTDGLSVWKSLYERGVRAIIRGDMAFGVDAMSTEFEARRLGRLTLLTDYHNLPNVTHWDVAPQDLGERYSRKPGETLETWRDRCYQTYAVPAVLAALTDIKTPYVEVISPLLSNSIIDCVRTHPDSLRTNKRLFIEIVRKLSPKIPYAETSAPMDVSLFLKKKEVVDLMLSELESVDRPSAISNTLVQFIKDQVIVSEEKVAKRSTFRKALRPYAPQRALDFAERIRDKQALDVNMLAFRAFLVCKMTKMLNRDATLSQ